MDGTTHNAHFDFELEGFDRSQDSTVLEFARGLVVDFYDTALRISLNTMHAIWESPLLDVKMLEMLIVQVGPAKEFDDPLLDGEDYEIVQPELHPAELLITSQGTPVSYGNYVIGRKETDPRLDSELNITIAKNWISKCRKEHGNSCGADTGDLLLPTRVIDVGSGSSTGNDKPKLFISHGAKGDYIALSHCWGGPIATVLQTTNIKDFCQALPYDQLPLNFKDAINITRRLGVRYIWIDSLCIMQDSSDDWTIESTKMAAVYENAVATIAALCSPGSSHGILPRAAQHQSNSPDAVKIDGPGGATLTLQVYKQDEDEDLRDLFDTAPLTSRGWCFQESVLSRRVLYYGTKQVYWECGEGFQAANGVPGPNLFPKSGAGVNTLAEFLLQDFSTVQVPFQGEIRKKLLWDYYSTVSSYSRRKLTFNTDKLPAFSGLAQRLQPLIGDDYLAGLWKGDMRQGLLWGGYDTEESLEFVKTYRAPSWSWASRDGPVYFRRQLKVKASDPSDIEILEAQAQPKDKRAPFAEVTEGHLLVRGLTLKLRRIHGMKIESDDPVGQARFDNQEMAGGRTGPTTHLYASRTSESDPTICVGPDRSLFGLESQYQKLLGRDEQRDYLVLWVSRPTTWVPSSRGWKNDRVHCIILEKAQEVGVGEDVYCRVGYFATYPDNHEVIGEWKLRTLKII